ncbi:LysR substrate-binding domain-containing protein [Kitasatospora sp. NPDC090091]|uniref:LysR substrate-binding domain-containing protein n=1 Tax=Kitasatospora sp. NPDC090091 TaxID=3364081 RepID=UPI0037FEAF94
MELRQVRYFLAVAEELHFGRAAERLHVVQPTVSQQVRRLERELGTELFDRTTRAVALTTAGAAFLPHARAILAAERAAVEAMAGHCEERTRVLRIGTNIGLGTRLERLLAALAERAPQLTVELLSTRAPVRLQQVRDGELDAAFVRGLERSPGLDLLPVWRDPLVAALPADHPLAAAEQVTVADLAALPLRIAPREANPHLVDLVTGACRAAGVEPVLGPEFTTDQDTLAAIGTGRPSWTVFYASQAEVLPQGRTVFRAFAEPLALQTFLAVRPTASARRLAPLLDACHSIAESRDPFDPRLGIRRNERVAQGTALGVRI